MKNTVKNFFSSEKTKKNALKVAAFKWTSIKFLSRLFLKKIKFIDSLITKKIGRKNTNVIYGIFVLSFVLYHTPSVLWNITGKEVTFVMEGRERIATQDGSDRYEIYTSEGLFINQNSLIRLKKNASILQSNLKFGATYQCSTQGYQWILMKKYRNLIRCQEVKSNQGTDLTSS